MDRLRKNQNRTHITYLVVILVVFAFQAYLVWTNYARLQLYYFKSYGRIVSVQRSEIIALGFNEAKFVRFLDSIIPEDAPVILPPGSNTWFSSQNIMQYYLFPRQIWPCDETCIDYGNNPNSFVIAMDGFPPQEIVQSKILIPFPESGDRYIGVYAPENLAQSQTGQVNEYQGLSFTPLSAPIIDLLILLAFLLAGGLIVILLLDHTNPLECAALGLPISLGLLSWLIFIGSNFGIPINMSTISIIFSLLVFASLLGIRILQRPLPAISARGIRSSIARIWQAEQIELILSLILLAFFALSLLVSVSRGYSVFDDITNWSLKGYAIAYQGTIWAGETWGGHSMAYPMDLQLSIAVFKLASNDLLPGSKMLFPLFAIVLLLGCSRFLGRHAVDPRVNLAGMLALFSTPIIFRHSTFGMANLPFTAYLVLAILWQIEALEKYHPGKMIIAGLLYAFAAWTRPEGIGFAFVFMLAVFLLLLFLLKIKPSWKLVFLALLPVILFPLMWILLLGKAGMDSDQVGNALSVFFNQGSLVGSIWTSILQIGRSSLDFLLNWKKAGLIVPLGIILFAFGTLYNKNALKTNTILLVLAALAVLLPFGMFFVASFSESDFPGFLNQSLDRALIPAMTLFWVAALLAAGVKKPKDGIIKT
jgi:hypothetical protein